MKYHVLQALVGLGLLLILNNCLAQESTGIKKKAVAGDSSTHTVKDVLTADSLASGNTKDVLTSFFQLAFNKLTGPDKELNFSSNPFAIMLKSDTSLAVDTNYYKYRVLRNTNFGFGLKLDSSYRFNGFSSGVTYALINKRDSSTSPKLFYEMRHNKFYAEVDSFQTKLTAYTLSIKDLNTRKQFNQLVNAFLSKDTAFNKLDSSFQRIVISIAQANKDSFPTILHFLLKKPSYNLEKMKRNVQDSLKSKISNDWLWTLGLSDTTYKDQFFFSNIVLRTELIKGLFGDTITHPGSNFELDVKSCLNFLDDSLVKTRNLRRTLFSVEPGINWVIRSRNSRQSWLEFKFSGSYSHNLTTLYPGENRDSLAFNGTLRVRIINNIWVPLTIRYDPRSGNFLGFLDIKLNFSSFSGLIKRQP